MGRGGHHLAAPGCPRWHLHKPALRWSAFQRRNNSEGWSDWQLNESRLRQNRAQDCAIVLRSTSVSSLSSHDGHWKQSASTDQPCARQYMILNTCSEATTGLYSSERGRTGCRCAQLIEAGDLSSQLLHSVLSSARTGGAAGTLPRQPALVRPQSSRYGELCALTRD